MLILCERDGRLRLCKVGLVVLRRNHARVLHERAFRSTTLRLAAPVDSLLRIVLNTAIVAKACGSSWLRDQAIAVVDVIARFEDLDAEGLRRSVLVKICL